MSSAWKKLVSHFYKSGLHHHHQHCCMVSVPDRNHSSGCGPPCQTARRAGASQQGDYLSAQTPSTVLDRWGFSLDASKGTESGDESWFKNVAKNNSCANISICAADGCSINMYTRVRFSFFLSFSSSDLNSSGHEPERWTL